ncbi:hypothetical protein D3C71_1272240 [compost metagenome]
MVIIAEKLNENPKSTKAIRGMLNQFALLIAEKSNTPIKLAEIHPTTNAIMTEIIRKIDPLLRNIEPRITNKRSVPAEIRANKTF